MLPTGAGDSRLIFTVVTGSSRGRVKAAHPLQCRMLAGCRPGPAFGVSADLPVDSVSHDIAAEPLTQSVCKAIWHCIQVQEQELMQDSELVTCCRSVDG